VCLPACLPGTAAWAADEVSVSGDLRLRYEGFSAGSPGLPEGRDRFRYRLRLRAGVDLSERFALHGELRSGNPDNPVSDNQTFDGGGSKKEISIAQANVAWTPGPEWEIRAGKMSPKSLWWSSDMQYDDDIVPEGVLGRWERGARRGERLGVAAAAYVFALEESSTGTDSYLSGAQAALTWKAGADEHRWRLGAGYDAISHPQGVADLTVADELAGNALSHFVDQQGRLISDFRIASVFAGWKQGGERNWPVELKVHAYQNTGAEGPGADEDMAWFARASVGDDGRPRGTEVRLTRYYSEPDAVFYVFMQSDTRRSSNVDGYRADFRHRVAPWGKINVTWYHTDLAVGESPTMDRWQVDLILSF
jgi:hypothetical protein